MRRRLPLDIALLSLILFALAYQLSGNLLHEIAGTIFLALAVLHNLIARRWYMGLRREKMGPRRAIQTVLNLALLATALLLVASGVTNSHDLFPFLRPGADILDYHTHALAAWWMLVLASLHLGLHWPAVFGEACRVFGLRGESRFARLAGRAAGALFVMFGIYAVFERDLLPKLAGLYAFDDWDFDRSVVGFFLYNIAIVSVGVFLMRLVMRLIHPPQGGWRACRGTTDRAFTAKIGRPM
jgi:hypothetical protein